ncbi:hypothetical protein HN51_050307, partial [Arachis hypogaea]
SPHAIYLKAKLEEAILGHNLFDEKIEESKKINEAIEGNNNKEVKKKGADKEGVEPVKEQEEKKTIEAESKK